MTLGLTNPDRKPLRDLPDDVRGAMFNAWLKGAVVECHYRHADAWLDCEPNWNASTTYRIRPTPVTPDVIPWAALQPWVQWVARDENGAARAFLGTPTGYSSGKWCPRSGDYSPRIDNLVAGFVQGTCDWRDSLQQRPEGV